MAGTYKAGDLIISDTQQYYWMLPCGQHVSFQGVQATMKQLKDTRRTPLGQLHPCLRCASPHKHGPEPTGVRNMSMWVQQTWSSLEALLANPVIAAAMIQHGRDNAAPIVLVGPQLGYVVETKVLKGRYGAADIYVPSINLIVQVDGEHHNNSKQLAVDLLFDTEARKQGYRLLRVCYKDIPEVHGHLHSTIKACLQCSNAFVLYSASHPRLTHASTE
jgi:hypothetical protein